MRIGKRRLKWIRVAACTGLLLMAVTFAASFLKQASVSWLGPENPDTRTHREITLYTHPGVFALEYRPARRSHWDSERREGPKVEIDLGYPYASDTRRAWFWPTRAYGGSMDGSFTRWHLPMSWPLLGLAGVLACTARRARPSGPACPHCGYPTNGLVAPTCPECGANLR